jgi:ribose 5-phosphate isomerase A
MQKDEQQKADREAEKQIAARRAVAYVKDGMHVGLGSGTTAAYAIQLLGKRILEEGLKVTGVATSAASRALALLSGIPLVENTEEFTLDLAIDGADQATRAGELLKGGGGALLHERIVAVAARSFIVIGDSTKLVQRLGTALLPIEVYTFGWRNVLARLRLLGCEATVRLKDGGPFFITEEGNYLIDCRFPPDSFPHPAALNQNIRNIPGVADHGLFLGMADLILIARGNEVDEITVNRK